MSKEGVFDISHFDKMIKKMAWYCYRKLSSLGMYTITDLIQEGYLALLERLKYYDPEKSAPSTFAYMSLRSHYANILKKENRFTNELCDSEFLEEWHTGKAYLSPAYIIELKNTIKTLPVASSEAAEIALTMPQGLFILIRRKARREALKRGKPVGKINFNRKALQTYLKLDKRSMNRICSDIMSVL